MMTMTLLTRVMVLVTLNYLVTAQKNIVAIVDQSLAAAGSWLGEAVNQAQNKTGENLKLDVLEISIEDETSAENELCASLSRGVSVILDITAGGWDYAVTTADSYGIPYLHSQVSIYQHMAAMDALMQNRNATDAALVFSGEHELDQALYYLVEGSSVRVIVLVGFGSDSSQEVLRKMRPAPAYYVLFGTAMELEKMLEEAARSDFVKRDSRWTVIVTGTDDKGFRGGSMPGNTTVTIVTPHTDNCCIVQRVKTCNCSKGVNMQEKLIHNTVLTVAETLKAVPDVANVQGDCNTPLETTGNSREAFYASIRLAVGSWPGMGWDDVKHQMMPLYKFTISTKTSSKGALVQIGSWDMKSGLSLSPEFKNTPIKRYFRVGSIQSRPWFYQDSNPGSLSFEGYSGYCVELALRLSQMMEFEFTFVTPKDNKFGGKMKNGSWNGLVADLANGVTDLIVAPLTMTSEREEVIDFVAPYFDQSGISIVIRKREREEHLFKFMTVLKFEVWLSIIAALVVTGIMLWLLDRYSPYSGQNNTERYSEECRKFTLKESFWFALTSFTPQGGGEAPKALSGRILVAAYWLFVVLMLATFTANLAAFLTVERMQTPVSSLEELAGQSKINYTVMQSSSILDYFRNMAGAEEELYRVWKELTLNSTTDQSKYRVWDYPIKEQYTHILQIIESTGPVETSAEAFERVLANTKGELAFIHDAAEIRYEIYQNCYLLEVGEPFAEQPYAIAVQQGSYLQEEISRAILELQKERYFESLLAKFWNSSAKGDCPNDDDSEGITLQSLGGVFIATLIGLVLALIALAGEVLFYRKGSTNSSTSDLVEELNTPDKLKKMVVPLNKEQISRINVTPAY